MKQRPSSVSNGSVPQDMSSILCNLEVDYGAQKSLPLVPVLSQMNPVYTF
jgi:hypothetical protein